MAGDSLIDSRFVTFSRYDSTKIKRLFAAVTEKYFCRYISKLVKSEEIVNRIKNNYSVYHKVGNMNYNRV